MGSGTYVGVSSVVAGILGRVRRQEDIMVEVNEYVYLQSVEVVFFYASIRLRRGILIVGVVIWTADMFPHISASPISKSKFPYSYPLHHDVPH
jgi:hypothetical protein